MKLNILQNKSELSRNSNKNCEKNLSTAFGYSTNTIVFNLFEYWHFFSANLCRVFTWNTRIVQSKFTLMTCFLLFIDRWISLKIIELSAHFGSCAKAKTKQKQTIDVHIHHLSFENVQFGIISSEIVCNFIAKELSKSFCFALFLFEKSNKKRTRVLKEWNVWIHSKSSNLRIFI